MKPKTLKDFKEEIEKEINRIEKLKEELTSECWLNSELRLNYYRAKAKLELLEREREEAIKWIKFCESIDVSGYNDPTTAKWIRMFFNVIEEMLK